MDATDGSLVPTGQLSAGATILEISLDTTKYLVGCGRC